MAILMNRKDEVIMKLVHYFVTEEDYSPIVVNGVKDEVWLQNRKGPYKIVRINANYIHNNEQYEMDLVKIKNVMRQVKRKTLSWSMNALNILLDVNDDVFLEDERNIASVKFNKGRKIREQNILEVFPDINQKMLEGQGLDLMIDITNDINAKTERENRLYEGIFKEKKIIFTILFILINVLVFLSMFVVSKGSITGNVLMQFGGLSASSVLSGQVWRLITAGFLHSGFLHLLFNMYSLYLIGSQIENFVGKVKFVIIYLFSLLCASLMSCIMHPAGISVGASGAIFGLLGALVYFGWQYRLYLGSVLRNQIIPVILFNLALGFIITGVDNAAHIGGLIGGLLIAMALGVQKTEDKQMRLNGMIVSIIYLAFLLYVVFFR